MNLDKGDLEEDPGDSGYKCPLCLMILSSKASYARHVNFTCKKKKQGSDILTTKRVSPVPATQVQVDKELDGLLANVPESLHQVEAGPGVRCDPAGNLSCPVALQFPRIKDLYGVLILPN